MTEQIYNIDAYKKEIKSTIIEIIEDYFVVDKTIFFPGGGGQPNDFGLIKSDKDSFKISKVNWRNGKIAHFLCKSDLSKLKVGDEVTCILDWERRYKLMRTHTSLHILCGVIWRDYQAAVTGGNMEPIKGRMDFDFPSL